MYLGRRGSSTTHIVTSADFHARLQVDAASPMNEHCSGARLELVAVGEAARRGLDGSDASFSTCCARRGPVAQLADFKDARTSGSTVQLPSAARNRNGPLSAERQGRKRPYLDEMNEFFDDSKCDATRGRALEQRGGGRRPREGVGGRPRRPSPQVPPRRSGVTAGE